MKSTAGLAVVAASALGIAISPGTIVFYTLGVLMGPIAEATGWDRSAIAFAASVFTFVLIFTIPAVGVLIDRFGVRRVLIPSQLLFGATFVGISLCRTIGICTSPLRRSPRSAPAQTAFRTCERFAAGSTGIGVLPSEWRSREWASA